MNNHKMSPALLVVAALLAALVAGCTKRPEMVERSTNPEVVVETLFTHDGCTVYRFEDGGRTHYFARCGNKVETISPKMTSCGKGCVSTRDENIRTE